jgi:hypothetical protein
MAESSARFRKQTTLSSTASFSKASRNSRAWRRHESHQEIVLAREPLQELRVQAGTERSLQKDDPGRAASGELDQTSNQVRRRRGRRRAPVPAAVGGRRRVHHATGDPRELERLDENRRTDHRDRRALRAPRASRAPRALRAHGVTTSPG